MPAYQILFICGIIVFFIGVSVVTYICRFMRSKFDFGFFIAFTVIVTFCSSLPLLIAAAHVRHSHVSTVNAKAQLQKTYPDYQFTSVDTSYNTVLFVKDDIRCAASMDHKQGKWVINHGSLGCYHANSSDSIFYDNNNSDLTNEVNSSLQYNDQNKVPHPSWVS